MAIFYDEIVRAGTRYAPQFLGQNGSVFADDLIVIAPFLAEAPGTITCSHASLSLVGLHATIAIGGIVPEIVTPIFVFLTDASNRVIPNLTGLTVAWWDDPDLVTQGAADNTWTAQTTSSTGKLSVTDPGTSITTGETGWIEVTNSDGTNSQSPVAKIAAGRVTIN